MLSVAKHQIEPMSSWPRGVNLGATNRVISKNGVEALQQRQCFFAVCRGTEVVDDKCVYLWIFPQLAIFGYQLMA